MNPPVESRDGRFGRGLIEGIKCARILGRQQAMVNVCRVGELLDAKHFSEDVRCRARLHRVSGGVARKIRRQDVGHPITIDIVVDVGHRTLQVVGVFRIP